LTFQKKLKELPAFLYFRVANKIYHTFRYTSPQYYLIQPKTMNKLSAVSQDNTLLLAEFGKEVGEVKDLVNEYPAWSNIKEIHTKSLSGQNPPPPPFAFTKPVYIQTTYIESRLPENPQFLTQELLSVLKEEKISNSNVCDALNNILVAHYSELLLNSEYKTCPSLRTRDRNTFMKKGNFGVVVISVGYIYFAFGNDIYQSDDASPLSFFNGLRVLGDGGLNEKLLQVACYPHCREEFTVFLQLCALVYGWTFDVEFIEFPTPTFALEDSSVFDYRSDYELTNYRKMLHKYKSLALGAITSTGNNLISTMTGTVETIKSLGIVFGAVEDVHVAQVTFWALVAKKIKKRIVCPFFSRQQDFCSYLCNSKKAEYILTLHVSHQEVGGGALSEVILALAVSPEAKIESQAIDPITIRNPPSEVDHLAFQDILEISKKTNTSRIETSVIQVLFGTNWSLAGTTGNVVSVDAGSWASIDSLRLHTENIAKRIRNQIGQRLGVQGHQITFLDVHTGKNWKVQPMKCLLVLISLKTAFNGKQIFAQDIAEKLVNTPIEELLWGLDSTEIVYDALSETRRFSINLKLGQILRIKAQQSRNVNLKDMDNAREATWETLFSYPFAAQFSRRGTEVPKLAPLWAGCKISELNKLSTTEQIQVVPDFEKAMNENLKKLRDLAQINDDDAKSEAATKIVALVYYMKLFDKKPKNMAMLVSDLTQSTQNPRTDVKIDIHHGDPSIREKKSKANVENPNNTAFLSNSCGFFVSDLTNFLLTITNPKLNITIANSRDEYTPLLVMVAAMAAGKEALIKLEPLRPEDRPQTFPRLGQDPYSNYSKLLKEGTQSLFKNMIATRSAKFVQNYVTSIENTAPLGFLFSETKLSNVGFNQLAFYALIRKETSGLLPVMKFFDTLDDWYKHLNSVCMNGPEPAKTPVIVIPDLAESQDLIPGEEMYREAFKKPRVLEEPKEVTVQEIIHFTLDRTGASIPKSSTGLTTIHYYIKIFGHNDPFASTRSMEALWKQYYDLTNIKTISDVLSGSKGTLFELRGDGSPALMFSFLFFLYKNSGTRSAKNTTYTTKFGKRIMEFIRTHLEWITSGLDQIDISTETEMQKKVIADGLYRSYIDRRVPLSYDDNIKAFRDIEKLNGTFPYAIQFLAYEYKVKENPQDPPMFYYFHPDVTVDTIVAQTPEEREKNQLYYNRKKE
jgi:hypothetical protein